MIQRDSGTAVGEGGPFEAVALGGRALTSLLLDATTRYVCPSMDATVEVVGAILARHLTPLAFPNLRELALEPTGIFGMAAGRVESGHLSPGRPGYRPRVPSANEYGDG